jgi:hypothetical protein
MFKTSNPWELRIRPVKEIAISAGSDKNLSKVWNKQNKPHQLSSDPIVLIL